MSDAEVGRMLILRRGRAYMQQSRYPVVQVYTTRTKDADVLISVYGGNYYPRGSGWIWICGKRREIMWLVEDIVGHVADVKGARDRLACVLAWADAHIAYERLQEVLHSGERVGTGPASRSEGTLGAA